MNTNGEQMEIISEGRAAQCISRQRSERQNHGWTKSGHARSDSPETILNFRPALRNRVPRGETWKMAASPAVLTAQAGGEGNSQEFRRGNRANQVGILANSAALPELRFACSGLQVRL